MRVHQIITGSCNGGYSHIGQAKVRESNYIVYASGCDVVILNESFCRSQVISGCELGNSVITAVAFNHHYGKIAVANADGIFIYEPQATTESVLTNSSKLFWLFSSHLSLPSRSQVICLSWSHRPCFQFSNCGLLAGLDDGSLFMWRLSIKNNIADLSTRRFQVGPSLINSEKSLGTDLVPKESLSELQSKWKIAWCHRLNGTPLQIDFSPDGSYFASITKCDDKRSSCKGHKFYNEMHVWFRDPCFELSQLRNSYDSEQFRMTENWESILLPHPCNVCSFSWRHSSRYLPSGWMPNVLLTAGEDNLCRVWIEVSHPTINNSTTSSLGKQFSKDDSAVPMSSTVIKLYLPLGLTDVQSKQQKEAAINLTNESGESSTQLTDPLSKIEVDYGSNAPLFPMKLDGKMYEFMQNSYPQFTFTTSLPLDCFPEISNISSLNDAQIGQLTVHWFNNKEYHLNAQLESFLMDTVSRILAIPVQIVNYNMHRMYIHGLDLSVPNPKAIRTQKVIIPHESSHRDKKFSCEAAFTLIPNLKSRLTQVTYSIRSRLHQAIPLDAANSLSSRLFTYLTTDFSKNPVNYFNYETTTSKHHHQQQQFLSDTTKNQPTETSSYLMTINYQDNLDIFCHLFLLKYSIRQCIMQWLKGPMNHFVVNNSKKHLEQFKQTILKPMLSSLAQIHLNSTTLGSRNQNSSHVAMITMHTNGSLPGIDFIQTPSTSHYEYKLERSKFNCGSTSRHLMHPHSTMNQDMKITNYSEVILWYVSSVGPLSTGYTSSLLSSYQFRCSQHTVSADSQLFSNNPLTASDINGCGNISSHGGISEVARLILSNNCSNISSNTTPLTFRHIAWFPCMITTVATSYPVALFVASLDGANHSGKDNNEPGEDQLGLFLTFSKLKQINKSVVNGKKQKNNSHLLHSSMNSDTLGCIIQLDYKLSLSSQIFKNYENFHADTLVLHVFPSELIVSNSEISKPTMNLTTSTSTTTDPIQSSTTQSDISPLSAFLIVRLTRYTLNELVNSSSVETSCIQTDFSRMEMWQVRISTSTKYCNIVDGISVKSSVTDKFEPSIDNLAIFNSMLSDAIKVCDCKLSLPPGVSIVCAQVSAAHVSWAALSTFNAPPPYLIVSACSDGCLRFWRCQLCSINSGGCNHPTPDGVHDQFAWEEWRMPLMQSMSSCIELQLATDNNANKNCINDSELVRPIILGLDCAYSGRLAVAYTQFYNRIINDTMDERSHLDLSLMKDANNQLTVYVTIYECESSGGCEWILEDTIELTSETYFLENSIDKLSIQLDWVNTEDGGHLLSVIIDSEVFVFAPFCQNLTLSHNKLRRGVHPSCQPTLMTTIGEVYIGWKPIACTRIFTADFTSSLSSLASVKKKELSPASQHQHQWYSSNHNVHTTTPSSPNQGYKQAAWLRDGLLLISAKTEMQLFSQWPSDNLFNLLKWHVKPKMHIVESPWNSSSSANESFDAQTTVMEPDADDSTVSGSSSMSVARLTKAYSPYPLKPSHSSSLLHTTSHSDLHATTTVSDTGTKSQVMMTSQFSQIDLNRAINGGLCVKSNEQLSKDVELLSNLGLFEAIQLLEWMNLGHLRRIKAILAHLTRCLSAVDNSSQQQSYSQSSGSDHRRMTKGNLNSELANFVIESYDATMTTNNPTGKSLRSSSISHSLHSSSPPSNLLETHAIPPLPLYVLLAVDSLQMTDVAADMESRKHFDPISEWNDEHGLIDESKYFEIQDDDLNLTYTDNNEDKNNNTDKRNVSKRIRPSNLPFNSTIHNTPSHLCGFSIWSLKPASLARNQMYLLGIADLMAKTHSNITDCLSEVNSSTNKKKLPRQTSMKQDSKEDLDECGLRFLLTVQLYSYLSKTLPPARRSQLLSSGLTNSSLVWAYHSDSEEELLAQLPIAYNQSGGCSGGSAVSSDLNWSDFKRYGCAFQNTKDPMEAAVFYLAMHKAKMVAALFKTTGNKILENFFRSDFTPGQPACRQAKLNAFRLLSQHKYLQAAGLFLLAGCLDDAVRVCLDTLKDLQMGIVLVRLYTSSALGVSSQPSSAISEYHAFLKNHGDPLAALETLLEGPGTVNDSEDLQKSETKNSLTNSFYQSPQHPQYLSGSQGPGICGTTSTPSSVCPSVFKFYTYLQSHPLVLRHQRLQTPSLNNSSILYRVKSLERRLYFRTAHHYFVLGCPTLALEVLTKLPRLQSFNSSGSSTFNISTNDESLKSYRQSELRMDIMKSTNTQNGSTLNIYDDGIFTLLTNDDRSQKYEVSKTQDQFTIEWSDEDDGADNDNEKKDIIDEKKSSTFCADREQPGESQQRPSLHSEDNFNVGSQGEVDLMANQLKFIACLKILAEELSTLAAAIVNTLTRINKSTSSTSATSVMNNFPTINAAEKLNECNPDYSEFSGPLTTTSYLLTTKNVGSVLTGIFVNLSSVSPEIRDAELKRLKTRYDWIKAHETFLISLINFCDLYGSSGIRLPAVRIELSLLLNELYSSSYLFTCQSKVPLHNNHLYKSDSNLVATRVGGGNVGHPSLDSCWPISTMALIDSIPLLRTLLRLPSGALLLPDSVKRIKYMVHDLITCLELLPPPFLASILLPYPYQHNRHCATTTKSKSLYNDALKKSSSLFHCANCILAPTADRHRRVFLLRNLCAALSACIHQCLSVGGWLGLGYTIDENSVQSNPSSLSRKVFALPATSTVNIRSVDRLCVSDQTFRPNTEPSKWPGLTCLKNYTDPQLQSNSISTSQIIRITSTQSLQDCDSPPSSTVTRIQSVDRRRFIGLLAQALAASYFGLLIYALHTRDACTLYRLACARLDAKTWNRVFGGTYRAKPFRPPTQPGSNTTTTNISFGLMSDKKTILQKPPTRPKQPSLVNKQQDRSKSRSPEKNVTRASDRAAAALEVASKIGSPPITSVLTSQHIRFLAHAEASAIADTTRSDVVEQKMSAVTMSQSSISPEEWFIFAQSSILSCLLERPVKYTDVIDDSSEIFDSDASEPSPNDEYNTYHTALFKQRRRVNRIQRFIKHCHALKQRKTVHHRMKHSLHYRLTGQLVNNNNNNNRDHSDEVDDTDGDVNDDDEQKVNDNLEDSDDYYDHLDVQHPTEVNNETPNEVKDESGKLSSPTKLNLSNLQPQWILRRLHLNPDFIDTWWGSQLESEFYEALEILHARSDKRQTTHTNLKDYPEFNSTAGYLNDANDTNDNEEEEVDEDDDYNLTVDALGNRKLAFFENDRQWAYSDSYAWRLIRLGLMQLAKRELNRLIQIIDFNGEDLAVYGPGLVTLIRLVDCWLTGYRSELSSPPALNPIQLKLKLKGLFMNDEHLIPPKDFLPDIQEDLSSSSASQTATMKGISNLGTVTSGETTKLDLPSAGATRSITRDPFSLPVKRLWCYLVRQPDLDDTFLRHIFRKPYLVQSTDIQKSSGKQTRTHQQTQSTNQTAGSSLLLNDAVRLIHKEHDPLIAMCINQVNFSAIAIATPKEIIELDIGNLVNLPPWFADEIEYDLELMRRPQTRRYPEGGTDDFIVCDTTKNSIKVATNDPSDVMTSNNITSSSTVASMSASDNNPSGSGTHVILKRTLPAVYNLCGTGTGSVHMFEWSTPVPVVAGFTNTYSLTAAACMSGQFPAGSRGARVTALQFDDSGYRFGCGDADGNFGLWNLYSTMPGKLPYFRCRCHAKGLADFCFLGCSSLIVTVGNGGITTTASTSFVSGVEGGFGETGSAGTGVNYGSSGPTHYTSTSIIGSGSSSSYSSGNVSVDQDASHLTLWDTLLPSNRCGVLDPELDAPCTSIAYCGSLTSINSWPRNTDIYSLNNMIYSYTSTITPTTTNSGRFFTGSGGDSDRTVVVGTKNGDICTVDMRNPKVLHKFSAHDSPIRTLCIDSATNCLVTGGADGIVKIWRLSEQELLTSFCGDLHPSRGAAAVAAAALFRGNQPAAIIAATNPGISNIRLLPTVTGAALLHVNTNNDSNLLKDDSSTNLGTSAPTHFLHDQKCSMTTASTACRFLSCGADGGLRMRSLVVRPKPFMVC
ncbi:DmX-like protein 2 [Schistosoma japonicum]|nr:DmX-like protein 2 [Schistosoma japonicum]